MQGLVLSQPVSTSRSELVRAAAESAVSRMRCLARGGLMHALTQKGSHSRDPPPVQMISR